MDLQLEHPAVEIKRLQRCINDLVSVLALPAIWSGRWASLVVRTLLDSLNCMSPPRPWSMCGLQGSHQPIPH